MYHSTWVQYPRVVVNAILNVPGMDVEVTRVQTTVSAMRHLDTANVRLCLRMETQQTRVANATSKVHSVQVRVVCPTDCGPVQIVPSTRVQRVGYHLDFHTQ